MAEKVISFGYLDDCIWNALKKSEYHQEQIYRAIPELDCSKEAESIVNDESKGIECVLFTKRLLKLFPDNFQYEALLQILKTYEYVMTMIPELTQPKRYSMFFGYVRFNNLFPDLIEHEVREVIHLITSEIKRRNNESLIQTR